MSLTQISVNVPRATGLPDFFRPLFWSYHFDALDLINHERTIVVQTINYGSWDHWSWLNHHYGRERVAEVLSSLPSTAVRPQALALASVLFDVTNTHHAPRGAH